jgi:hypothetical protein
MSNKGRLILTTVNVWGPHVLVIPIAFSEHMILVYVVGQRHIHPAYIFLPFFSGAVVIWGWCWVAPLLWGPWRLPVLAQNFYNWHIITRLIHGLETDVICEETIVISRCGCRVVPTYIVLQTSSAQPDTGLQALWDPRLEVFSDLVGCGSANNSYLLAVADLVCERLNVLECLIIDDMQVMELQ